MSFKVYGAYKVVNPDHVWEITKLIQTQAELNARQALREYYIDLVRQMDPDTKEYKAERKRYASANESSFRLWHAHNLLRDGYKENVTRLDRSPYNLDVSFAVYPHKGQYYLRTFCDHASITGKALDFVENLPGLVDFHYQNSSDRPEEVSAKEWKHRETVWNEIVEPFHDVGHQLVVEVVSYDNHWRIDPQMELWEEWRKKPPKLPSREEVWAESLRKLVAFKKVTAGKGLIKAIARNPALCSNATVRAEGDKWTVSFAGKTLTFRTLNRAADRVYFEHLPESTRDLIRSYRKSLAERKRANGRSEALKKKGH